MILFFFLRFRVLSRKLPQGNKQEMLQPWNVAWDCGSGQQPRSAAWYCGPGPQHGMANRDCISWIASLKCSPGLRPLICELDWGPGLPWTEASHCARMYCGHRPRPDKLRICLRFWLEKRCQERSSSCKLEERSETVAQERDLGRRC